jgi:AraC family transcriptional activator of pobA
MKQVFEDNNTGGRFSLLINDPSLKGAGILNEKKETTNTIVFNVGPAQTVTIDQVPYALPANSALALVAHHHFIFEQPENLVAWQFNREFYCIVDHDAEVGCAGFLFYGIHHPMILRLTDDETNDISLLKNLSVEDMVVKDTMQGEMLRTLLKRLIIKITRIAKKNTAMGEKMSPDKFDLLRKFNMLLEQHFRTEHEVRFYAGALHRSPKTLSNLFALIDYPAPSLLIQRRIILEARRYMNFTKMTAKEIAYTLGFTSPAHFSNFFKKHSGINFSLSRYQETPPI